MKSKLQIKVNPKKMVKRCPIDKAMHDVEKYSFVLKFAKPEDKPWLEDKLLFAIDKLREALGED